jgi:hypothetical protein
MLKARRRANLGEEALAAALLDHCERRFVIGPPAVESSKVSRERGRRQSGRLSEPSRVRLENSIA